MFFKAVLLLMCTASCQAHFYNYVYMNQHCNNQQNEYLISTADKIWYANYGYESGPCVFTIKADYDSRIILNFSELDSSVFDAIDIFDGSTTSSVKLNTYSLSGYDLSPSYAYRSSGRYLTIRFRANIQQFSNTGFKAAATQFTTSYCIGYKCCNDDCINYDLRYDGVNNCYDNSDEWDVTGCLNTSALAGVVVGVSVFCTFCVVFLICLVRRRRIRRAQAMCVSQPGYPNYASTGYVQPAGIYQQPPHPHGGMMHPPQQQGGMMQPPPQQGGMMHPPPYPGQFNPPQSNPTQTK